MLMLVLVGVCYHVPTLTILRIGIRYNINILCMDCIKCSVVILSILLASKLSIKSINIII